LRQMKCSQSHFLGLIRRNASTRTSEVLHAAAASGMKVDEASINFALEYMAGKHSPAGVGEAFSEARSQDVVCATMKDCPSPRLKEVSEAMVRHLHGFVKETEPTIDEWAAAVDWLVQVGIWSKDVPTGGRHEWMLLSDTLGVTMLVDCINHRKAAPGSTEATVQGPFFGDHQLVEDGANLTMDGSDVDGSGTPALVTGRVLDVDGSPIAGAQVDVWLTSPDGFYAVQDPAKDPGNLCGYLLTQDDGSFSFKCIKPTPYKVPEDGPGGGLLGDLGRHAWRPAHLHFIAQAPGYQKLITHLFVKGDEYLYEDAVFAVLDSLIVEWPDLHDNEEAAQLGFTALPYTKVHYDFKLAKEV